MARAKARAPITGVLVACLLAGGLIAALAAAGALIARAQTAELLPDGSFEADADGWAGPSGATLDLVPGSVVDGVNAAELTTTGGTFAFPTQYWRIETVAGAQHTLRISLLDNAAAIEDVRVTLEFLADPPGDDLGGASAVLSGDSSAYRQLVIGPTTAPPGTAYARVVVSGTSSAAGAVLLVDGASLTREPLPTPSPTPSLTPTATSTPTASPTSTTSPTASPTSSPSPSPTPSPTNSPTPTSTSSPPPTASPTDSPTPSPSPTSSPTASPTDSPTPTRTPSPTPEANDGPRVFDTLFNGDFEAPGDLFGWTARGAQAVAADGLSGSGNAALLISESSATKWIHQTVRVDAGQWYRVAGRLRPDPGVAQAWLRIAWYASEDGSGSQLSTDDSLAVPGTTSAALAIVSSEPAQAPPGARSARVRVMLRPLGAGIATLVVDDVAFGPSLPPAPETKNTEGSDDPTEAAGPPPEGTLDEDPLADEPPALVSPAASPPPGGSGGNSGGSSPAGATRPAGGSGSSGGASSGGSTGSGNAGAGGSDAGLVVETLASEVLLRITEVLADPIESGPDAAYEWVEITNIGVQPVDLAGMVLRDNSGAEALPSTVLPAGASLIVAGPEARVPEAGSYRVPQAISNGLGNAGDRLALLTGDGRRVDALSWGTDSTYESPALRPPGAGRSIERHFADDGSLALVSVADTPTPGSAAIAVIGSEPVDDSSDQLDGAIASGSTEGQRVALTSRGGTTTDSTTWLALAIVAGGALAGAVAYRLREVFTGRDGW